MTKVQLYISNDNYEMLERAILIENDIEIELSYYCNVGCWQDSVIVYRPTQYGDMEQSYIHYYPHGHNNQEGNKILPYVMDCDCLEIYNNTGKELLVGDKLLEPTEVLVIGENGNV